VRIVTGRLASEPRGGYARTVIVVVGQPAYRRPSDMAPGRAVGAAVGAARAAAAAGATVQLVGRIGGDATGDELLLDLARARVGHAAVLRDAGRPTPSQPGESQDDPGAELDAAPSLVTADQDGDSAPPGHQRNHVAGDASVDAMGLDAADIELGLRDLTGYGVIVVAEPLAESTLAIVAEAAAYAEAQLVVIAAPGSAPPTLHPDIAVTLLEAPPNDPDEQFAGLVGRYAAALDAGVAADEAFRDALGGARWEPVIPST
jgi:hypothetical protein